MQLDEILANLSELSGDAVAVGFRGPGDKTAHFVWANRSFLELFGYEAREVIGKPVEMQHAPESADRITRAIRQQLNDDGFSRTEVLCLRKDGSKFWASLAVRPQDAHDRQGRYTIAVYREIDELKSREAAAAAALQERDRAVAKLQGITDRLVTAINTIPDPFAIYDKDNRLVLWNSAYSQSMTDDPSEIEVGMGIEDVLRLANSRGRFSEADGRVEEWLDEVRDSWLVGRGTVTMTIDDRLYQVYRNVGPNGDTVVLRVDVTELEQHRRKAEQYARRVKDAYEEIRYHAMHDDLTGLGNRRYLDGALKAALANRQKNGGEVAALHIDLDRFKQINDTMGHDAGDAVLKEVATRLRSVFRNDDAIARVGGDEFVAVLRCESGSDVPERAAQRVVDALSEPVMYMGKPCRFGASVGIARTPLAESAKLLAHSDVALYEAKRKGRAGVAVFDHSLLEAMEVHKRMADDILRGLEAGEFCPYYQPQYCVRTEQMVGIEALARWEHPTRGILLPTDFLPVAEDLNVVREIDRRIFEQAISDCSAIYVGSESPPMLGFNVSAARLLDDDIMSIEPGLLRYPGTVAFELVESIFMEEESEEFLFRLDALRDLGVELHMDDFGSGRASLVALTRIRPSCIKIDQRLVRPVTESAEAHDMVRAIVDIGRSLRMQVTAEGIETKPQLEILRDLGCDKAQGFLFSEPLPLSALAELHDAPLSQSG